MYARTTTFPRTSALAGNALLVAFFAALTALGAQIAIRLPFSPVPITLQVLMVIAAGLVLGSKRGFVSQLGYLTAGILGLPVFAGGTGGVAVLFGPTGGYLVAFPVAAFAAGWLSERLQGHARVGSFLAALAAIAILYVGGSLWLGVWLRGTAVHSLQAAYVGAWNLGVKPFILVDLAKALLAAAGVQGSRHLLTRWLGAEV